MAHGAENDCILYRLPYLRFFARVAVPPREASIYIYVYVYLMQLLRLTFVTFTLEVVGFQSSVDLMDYRTLAVVKRQCQVI